MGSKDQKFRRQIDARGRVGRLTRGNLEPEVPVAGSRAEDIQIDALKNILGSFTKPEHAGNLSKTFDVNTVRLTIDTPVSMEIALQEGRDGYIAAQERARDALLEAGGEALRKALPLYDLLSRLDSPPNIEPEKAKKIREVCLENKEGAITIVLTPGERTQLASRLQQSGHKKT